MDRRIPEARSWRVRAGNDAKLVPFRPREQARPGLQDWFVAGQVGVRFYSKSGLVAADPSVRLCAMTGNPAAARVTQSSRCLVVKPLTLSHSAGVILLTVTLKVQMWPSGSLAR